jgi:allantoate deiminase
VSAARQIEIDAAAVEDAILALARHGAHGETGVWRVAYSPEWSAAQAQVEEWLAAAGLEVRRDAVGNVWGRLEGSEAGPVIATGSHVDSQTPGGRYDGALGIVAAVAGVRALAEQHGRPRRTLEVVSLCEEEASRFRSASFWGSRAITGEVRREHLDDVRDEDGVSIGEAMAAAGLEPERFEEARRDDDLDTFVELHIEQGPRLEEEGYPVGIVTGITGIRHYAVELRGRSDHAGARPMIGRRDPVPGMAEIVLEAVGNALELGPPAVTTVGRIAVEPNLPSAVPDLVRFTVDARHPDAARQERLFARHDETFRRVADARGLDLDVRIPLDLPPAPCDPGLVATFEAAAAEQGVPAMTLHSGAGHDTQRMAKIAKTAMVFVRSKDGRSHTPAEFTSVEDAVAGIRVLAAGLRRLAY